MVVDTVCFLSEEQTSPPMWNVVKGGHLKTLCFVSL